MTRAAEQRKVFRLLGLFLNDAFCHRLILIQQKCKGAVYFQTFSQLQLHPLSTLGPKVLLAEPIRVREHTPVCVNKVVFVGLLYRPPPGRKWCEPDWLPEKEGNREVLYAADAGVVFRTEWVELKSPSHLRSDNVADGADTRTHSVAHILIILSGYQLVHEVQKLK